MKILPKMVVLLSIGFAACSQPILTSEPVTEKHAVATEEDAIALVLDEIREQGGDPQREECSARRVDGNWWVTAWHIWYPENEGSSRFVPGGYTVYVVSPDGKLVRTIPGL